MRKPSTAARSVREWNARRVARLRESDVLPALVNGFRAFLTIGARPRSTAGALADHLGSTDAPGRSRPNRRR